MSNEDESAKHEKRGGEVEYVKPAKWVNERVKGRVVKSFEVPPIKYFADEELFYLQVMLDIEDVNELLKRIEENRLGRKVLEKAFAVRIVNGKNNVLEPWPMEPPILPSIVENDADPKTIYQESGGESEITGIVSSYGYNRFKYVYSITINGIEDFILLGLLDKGFYREIYVVRNIEPRAIVKYNIYF